MKKIFLEISHDNSEIKKLICDEIESIAEQISIKYPDSAVSVKNHDTQNIGLSQYSSQNGYVTKINTVDSNGKLVITAKGKSIHTPLVLSVVEIASSGDLIVYSPVKENDGKFKLSPESFSGYTVKLSS